MEDLLAPFRSADIQVALGVNLLLAWGFYLTVVTGQLSLGHSAFMAVGAYGASIMTLKLGLPLWLALPGGTAVAALAGLLVGIPVLRLSGLYLAIATLGLVFIVTLILENWEYAGARLGISGMQGTSVGLVWIIVFGVGLGLALFDRSRLMLVMRAVREQPDAARAVGMNPALLRLGGFAAGAALCGLAGGLWAHHIIFIDPYQFGLMKSFEIVLFVVLGGTGSFLGPVLGATALTILPVWVRILKDWREIAFGVLLIAMMGFRPQGIVSSEWVNERRGRRRRRSDRLGSALSPLHPAPVAAPVPSRKLLLAVNCISKSFGGVRALSDVSFDVRRGEILGIIGPNGAGKSTLFGCVTGFIQPDEGDVVFDTARLTGLPPHRVARLGIRRTFQQGGIFRGFTVLDNIRAGQHAPSEGEHRQAITVAGEESAILSEVGLIGREAITAANLPYGDQRRLEIGRALAGRPQLLMLDEPAAGLNQTEASEIAVLLRRLREAGLTIILVEHNMSMVMTLCDRLVVLDHGTIIGTGTPDAMSRDPAVLAAYLGEEDP